MKKDTLEIHEKPEGTFVDVPMEYLYLKKNNEIYSMNCFSGKVTKYLKSEPFELSSTGAGPCIQLGGVNAHDSKIYFIAHLPEMNEFQTESFLDNLQQLIEYTALSKVNFFLFAGNQSTLPMRSTIKAAIEKNQLGTVTDQQMNQSKEEGDYTDVYHFNEQFYYQLHQVDLENEARLLRQYTEDPRTKDMMTQFAKFTFSGMNSDSDEEDCLDSNDDLTNSDDPPSPKK